MKDNLPVTEDLDFHYLLTLMPPLKDVQGYQWLPELFSIIGYESLITLCKYAGGETIQIPTLDELSSCIEALQYFYDIQIKETLNISDVPDNIKELVVKIQEVYNAENG